jgi:hypothetical protein
MRGDREEPYTESDIARMSGGTPIVSQLEQRWSDLEKLHSISLSIWYDTMAPEAEHWIGRFSPRTQQDQYLCGRSPEHVVELAWQLARIAGS